MFIPLVNLVWIGFFNFLIDNNFEQEHSADLLKHWRNMSDIYALESTEKSASTSAGAMPKPKLLKIKSSDMDEIEV